MLLQAPGLQLKSKTKPDFRGRGCSASLPTSAARCVAILTCHFQASWAAPNSLRSHENQNAPSKQDNHKTQSQNLAQKRPYIGFCLLHATCEGWSRQQSITAQHLQTKLLPATLITCWPLWDNLGGTERTQPLPPHSCTCGTKPG